MNTPRIIPLVQDVKFPTEKAILKMFGVRVNGKTLRAKTLGEKRKNDMVNSHSDTMKVKVGIPGSKERITALREQYATLEANNQSAFDVSDAQIVILLADTSASKGWDFV